MWGDSECDVDDCATGEGWRMWGDSVMVIIVTQVGGGGRGGDRKGDGDNCDSAHVLLTLGFSETPVERILLTF